MNKIIQILEIKVRGKAYKGKNMLNVEEFKKKKNRLLGKKNRAHLLSNIELYISDIELVCINERSLELLELLELILNRKENKLTNSIKFKLYWLLFLQSYFYVQRKRQTQEIVSKLSNIAVQTKNIEQESVVFLAKSLLWQVKGEEKKSFAFIEKAMKLIKNYERKLPQAYYQILYTHIMFDSKVNQNYEQSIKRMKLCFSYFLKTSNTLGAIKSYSMLLHFFALSKQEIEFNKLLNYIFKKKKIQKELLDSHYIILTMSTGTYCAIMNKMKEAIDYLNDAYFKIKKKNLQYENFYVFTKIMRILSRCYGFQGDFEKAYDLLVELVEFMEQDYVKNNILEEKRNLNLLNSYFSLLFIFVQLDMDIRLLTDNKLKVIYEHIKMLLLKTPISKYFLVESFVEDEMIKEIFNFESKKARNEIQLFLYQILLTQEPQKISEKVKKILENIRDFTYDPVYTDILLAKIHLSQGNFEKFKKLSKRLNDSIDPLKPSIIQIWACLFSLLSKYIENQNDQETILNLIDLQKSCKENNYKKMEMEIELYIKLISSKKTISTLKTKFKQTAFYDIFREESRQLIIETLN
ncbi:MAG: hypothetical protein ACTSP3_13885 [Candidatus Heimdallarchaeaceae archaeon]